MQEDHKQDRAPIIQALAEHRNSDTCILLGSGRSINDIRHWRKLKRYDLWTVNNWVYHPKVVPDFYHIEAKWYNYEILKRRFQQKIHAYRDVKFIFPEGKMIKLKDGTAKRLCDVVFASAQKLNYGMRARDPKRTHEVFSAGYRFHPQLITKSYDMSMTAIIEMVCRLGYRRIVTYGIDLYNSYYFWTGGDRKYGEVHHQTNKSHEDKDPEQPHATARILHFIIDFNARHMKPHGREICVGHEDTALNGYLRLLRPKEL